jgi:adenylosuccinate lyase
MGNIVKFVFILKICTDIRLLASMKEVEEPFEKNQIGKVTAHWVK